MLACKHVIGILIAYRVYSGQVDRAASGHASHYLDVGHIGWWKYRQHGVPCYQKSRMVAQGFHEDDTGGDKATQVVSQTFVHVLIDNSVKNGIILRRTDIDTTCYKRGARMEGDNPRVRCEGFGVQRETSQPSLDTEGSVLRHCKTSSPPRLAGHNNVCNLTDRGVLLICCVASVMSRRRSRGKYLHDGGRVWDGGRKVRATKLKCIVTLYTSFDAGHVCQDVAGKKR